MVPIIKYQVVVRDENRFPRAAVRGNITHPRWPWRLVFVNDNFPTSEERNPTWLLKERLDSVLSISTFGTRNSFNNHFGNRSVSHCILVIAWSISWHCIFTRVGKKVTSFYSRSWYCESRWGLSNYISPSKNHHKEITKCAHQIFQWVKVWVLIVYICVGGLMNSKIFAWSPAHYWTFEIHSVFTLLMEDLMM